MCVCTPILRYTVFGSTLLVSFSISLFEKLSYMYYSSLQVKDAKESIERELEDKVSELQQQIAATQQERKRAEQLTSSYDGQVKKLKELHCHCQEEAGKLKALLETKEAELSRMLTALQISAAQVGVCVCVCVCECSH